MLEKSLSGYDAQKEAKDAKAAKEPSKVSKTRKSRLAPDPHPSSEVCVSMKKMSYRLTEATNHWLDGSTDSRLFLSKNTPGLISKLSMKSNILSAHSVI